MFSSAAFAATSCEANVTTSIVVCMSGLLCVVVDWLVVLIVVDTAGTFTVVVYVTVGIVVVVVTEFFVVIVVVVTGVVVVVLIVVVVVLLTVTAGVVKVLLDAVVGDGVVNSSNSSIFLLIFSSCITSVVVDSDFASSGSLRKHFSILSWV